jgi:hypothetical protein
MSAQEPKVFGDCTVEYFFAPTHIYPVFFRFILALVTGLFALRHLEYVPIIPSLLPHQLFREISIDRQNQHMQSSPDVAILLEVEVGISSGFVAFATVGLKFRTS